MPTARDAYEAALQCLPFPGEVPALRTSGQGDAGDFADAACDSTAALLFDWKLTHLAVLDRLANSAAPRFWADVRDEGDDTLLLEVEAEDGAMQHRRLVGASARSRHEVVHTFVALWPGAVRVYALLPYERTDTTAYLLLTPQQERCLRSTLGTRWTDVLQEFPAPSGEAGGPAGPA